MQAINRPSRLGRAGVTLVAVGLVTGCSIYQPLDQGSSVPWAAAHQGGPGTGVASAELPGDNYVVRRGDRLGRLADRFGLTVPELAEANDLQPPYVIRVGQVLRVPAHAPGAGPAATMVAQGEPGPAAGGVVELAPVRSKSMPAKVAAPGQVAALEVAALPPAKDTVAASGPAAPATQRYTVRPGETLSGIARRLDVGLTELARANHLTAPYRLYAGQRLQVPEGGAYRTAVVELGDGAPSTVRLATGTPPPLNGNDFLWPVNGKVVGKYGPIDQWRRRDGIDIAARRGAPVLAAQDGIVAYAGDGIRGYGQMILLRHDQGYITTYAYNATLLVEVGDVVRRGQVIARVGDTGDATQTMLHFELRKGRKPIDPETRLVRDGTTLASTE
jgi:murein DD-endopeptidase MepM/ murein hydrolase activator NlpD